MVLMYIEAYGISIFKPETRLDARVLGMNIPPTMMIRGTMAMKGVKKSMFEGRKGRGGNNPM